jgi:drug/metabolite transporter (DMT)-like permease
VTASARMTESHRKGLLLVSSGALAWSLAGLIFRLTSVDVVTILCGRAAAAALFLLVVLLRRKGLKLPATLIAMGWPGLAVALLFIVDGACYMGALHFTSVAHLVVMVALTPLSSALIGLVVLKEPVRRVVWIAIGVSFIGAAVMVSASFGSSSLIGDLLAMGVPAVFGLVIVIMRRHPEVETLPTVFIAAAFSAVLFLPFARFGAASASDFVLMAALGMDEFGVGLMLYLAGAKLIPPAEAGLMSLLETVAAPLWVWIALGENPGLRSLAGGLLVLGALAGVAISDLSGVKTMPP